MGRRGFKGRWRIIAIMLGCLVLGSVVLLSRGGATDAVSARIKPSGDVEISASALQGKLTLDPALSGRIRVILRGQPDKWSDDAAAEWQNVPALPMAELTVDGVVFELHGGSCHHEAAEVRSWRDPLFQAMTAALIRHDRQWRQGERLSAERIGEAVEAELRGN
jgi:hypothetical protein